VLQLDRDTKIIIWLDRLQQYFKEGDSIQVSTTVSSQGGNMGPDQRTVTFSQQQQLTPAERSLLNDSRAVLEANKCNITIHQVQELIRSQFVQTKMQNGLFDEEDEIDRTNDPDGTLVIPLNARHLSKMEVVFSLRNSNAGQTRTLVRPPYFLVGSPGLEIEMKVSKSSLGMGGSGSVSQGLGNGPIEVQPSKVLFFCLKIQPQMHGLLKDVIVFNFGDFVICR
jgi:hypothetical protein